MRPAALVLLLASFATADDPKPTPRERVLPGLRKDGFVQLPNQWALKPAGRQVSVGDLPVNIQVHPTGQFAAVLHCGYQTHEVVILDLNPRQTRVVSRVTIPQGFYGLAFDPDGKQLYASGGEFDVLHVWDFDKGLLHNARTLDVSAGRRTVPAGLVFGPGGKELFACGLWANSLIRVPLDNPANKVVVPLAAPKPKPAERPKGELPSPEDNRKTDEVVPNDDDRGTEATRDNGYPYAVLVSADGKRAFVSLWAKAAVAVVDLGSNAVTAVWPTAAHPTELVLAPDGKALYVACANSTRVSVLDPADGTELQTITCSLYPQAPAGNTPNSLTLTPDGQLLFVANADANNLAAFQRGRPQGGQAARVRPDRLVPDERAVQPVGQVAAGGQRQGPAVGRQPERAEPGEAGPRPPRVHRQPVRGDGQRHPGADPGRDGPG